MNTVSTGFRANIKDRISRRCSPCVEDLVLIGQSDGHGIHKDISIVALVEFRFSSHSRNANAITIAANACDAVLLELLEDDRLGKRLPEVEEKLQEELSWIASIEPFVWQRLASFVPGLTSATLKNDCIWAANISASFMERKALSVARGLPWSLARGAMNSNLDHCFMAHPLLTPQRKKSRSFWS